MATRMGKERELQIIADYEESHGDVAGVAKRHNVAKQTVYNVLARNDVKTWEERRVESRLTPGVVDLTAQVDLTDLVEKVEWYLEGLLQKEALERTVDRLRKKYPAGV